MAKIRIALRNIKNMESFVNLVSKLDYNVYVRPEGASKETMLNAKSMLGMMSLSLHKRLELIVQTDDDTEILKKLRPYLV